MGKGAVTALLEIYADKVDDLKRTISEVSDEKLVHVFDPETRNPDCLSIQTILSHVVYAGFGYATTLLNRNGQLQNRPPKQLFAHVNMYMSALDDMVNFTREVFAEISDEELETCEESAKMLTGWQQRYDIEQLMEHAIVHILRHDRQIKNF
ncbi:DinB family protein [Flavobacterium sp.]|uniref:DinB family protein n=1 Tax=Flavobacterium sp. TaxID=239 RepID=UPI0025C35C1E|nr:DinB family protein [Flavobacterium sp.]